MTRMSFSDAKYVGKRKWRGVLLSEMDRMVP